MSMFDEFVDKLIIETPEFMIIKENNEVYVVFDRFVNSISDRAMSWLFKVYLEQNYKILKNDKIDLEFRGKYTNLNMQLISQDGNLFFNKDLMVGILEELYKLNQIKVDDNFKNIYII